MVSPRRNRAQSSNDTTRASVGKIPIAPTLYAAMNPTGTMKNSRSQSSGAESGPAVTRRAHGQADRGVRMPVVVVGEKELGCHSARPRVHVLVCVEVVVGVGEQPHPAHPGDPSLLRFPVLLVHTLGVRVPDRVRPRVAGPDLFLLEGEPEIVGLGPQEPDERLLRDQEVADLDQTGRAPA